MKKYKSLVSALLCAAMLLVGCNHNPATPDDPADDPTNTEQENTNTPDADDSTTKDTDDTDSGDDDPTAVKYKVTFDLNGGDGDAPAVQEVVSGKTATKPTDPTRTDFNFVGWTTTKDSVDTEFDFGTLISADITLYAYWSSDPVYKVTLDYNYAESTAGSINATKDKNYKINAPSATRDGYIFNGWYAEAACTTAITFPLTLSEAKTLYAKWSAYDTSTAVVSTGSIKVAKGLCSILKIADNPEGHNYQAAILPFAANATIAPKTGDKYVIRISGTTDVSFKELKCALIDTDASVGYWKAVSNYSILGDAQPGYFDFVSIMDISVDSVSVGSNLKLAIMYNGASAETNPNNTEANLVISNFEINGKSSKPALDLAKAETLASWNYDDVKSDDNWSINGGTTGVTTLNADDIYVVIQITTTDGTDGENKTHYNYGGGCIVNYQGGENQFMSLSLGAEPGTRNVIYSLEEIYDAMVNAGIAEPTYFKFNWWDSLGSLDKITLVK